MDTDVGIINKEIQMGMIIVSGYYIDVSYTMRVIYISA